jgi:hypothetical protein
VILAAAEQQRADLAVQLAGFGKFGLQAPDFGRQAVSSGRASDMGSGSVKF